jgi:hypothetical protein
VKLLHKPPIYNNLRQSPSDQSVLGVRAFGRLIAGMAFECRVPSGRYGGSFSRLCEIEELNDCLNIEIHWLKAIPEPTVGSWLRDTKSSFGHSVARRSRFDAPPKRVSEIAPYRIVSGEPAV